MPKRSYTVHVVEPFRIGNQLWWRPIDGADVTHTCHAGFRAVKRAATDHCQSMGVLHYQKLSCFPRGFVWRVTGTTGREMWFVVRARKNQ